jgi:mRNA interferase MazF
MPSFERGAVVSVPFPYTKGDTTQRRPALVVSDGSIANGMLLWVLMITSAENRPWPGDVALPNGNAALGLEAASIVRTLKIATIEADHARFIGRVPAEVLADVDKLLLAHLGLA